MSRLTRRRGRRALEHGTATVWAAWWILTCAFIGAVIFLGAAIEARQHHLDGAADLAALSAAGRLEHAGAACATAAAIATANNVGLATCRVEGGDVVVVLTDTIALPLGVGGEIRAEARAGP
jgi:secretion/DNA translocation related TadE-like protein